VNEMQLEKSELATSKDYDYEGISRVKTEELEELKWEKKHEDILYKILKYNPIDAINDVYRDIIDKLNLTDLEQRLQWWAAYIYVKFVMRALWNFKVEYPKKNIFPEWGPVILVSNHQSHLDPFFCGGAMHRPIYWMSKVENFKTPLVRTLFRNLCAFELDRDNPTQGWQTAKEILQKGRVVGIFPEGTRSKDGSLGEFKTGAVRLSIEMKAPIVPMAVIGSDKALPKGKLVMRPTQVLVRVGEPIYYFREYSPDTVTYNDIRKLTDQLREIITQLKMGTYGKSEEELSIGTYEEAAKPPKFNFKTYLKDLGKSAIQFVDDVWYSFLRVLEEFGVDWKFKETVYMFSAHVVDKWCDLMLPYKVIDYDKYIPDTGRAIVCSNHNSEWDVIMLATSMGIYKKRYIWQMSKQSLFQIPIVNAWVRNHFAFPLRRGAHDVDSYKFAKYLLEKEQLVTIYPEGTTNQGGGELLEGHTGAMRLAIETQSPIVLIGITGTEDTYPKHAKMLNFYRGCIFKAGPPFLEHKEYWGKRMPDYDELKRLTNNMMDRIRELMLYNEPDA